MKVFLTVKIWNENIIKMFKENHRLRDKIDKKVKSEKISKCLERKLVKDVCKDARTTIKTLLVDDLAKFGIEISKEDSH